MPAAGEARAPTLEVRSLTVEMGGRTALDDVDLSLHGGELVGLIGPNGAGKTTLLRAILGLVRPGSGAIELHGGSIDRARGMVGYVPQRHEFAWDFPVSVERAVMAARVHRVGWLRRPGRADREAVGAALERVGIAELGDRPVGELSGGQRQRVLVARALALEPRLLLLDEPFTGLDAPTRELLTELLEELRAEGRTLLVTTHDLEAAGRTCGRLCLLNTTVIASGPPAALADPEIWLRAFGVGAAPGMWGGR